MTMTPLRYRMYGFVPYNISPIQQGIQFGHAVVEYQLAFGHTEEYKRWATKDKTFVVLNGGTTSIKTMTDIHGNELPVGTLNRYVKQIERYGIRYATFHEEDLGDQLTAVVFLLSDRIWDVETYVYDDLTNLELEVREFIFSFNLA